MSDEDTTINVRGLEKLARLLGKRAPVARVGILGSKAGPHYKQLKAGEHQPSHIPTNAEVGAVHEFGSPSRNIPQRSFLRVPISERLGKALEANGAFTEEALKEVMEANSLVPWMEKVAILAEAITIGAFASRGFGKWPKWKDPNYQNNTGQVLVDTKQLRDAITSEVVGG